MTVDFDIVIPWVDGSDPLHEAKRKKNALALSGAADNSLMKSELDASIRWENYNELMLLLLSIEKNATWVRRIWIVTDNQSPDISFLRKETVDKISVVDHSVIFKGFESLLPVFNSASIEAMTWRIPGLSENYILLNDDIFFLKKTHHSYFFDNGKPIFRGVFNGGLMEPGLMWSYHRINGARLAGFNARSMLTLGHICQPVKISTIKSFYDSNEDVYIESASHKFRHQSQFMVASLMAHLSIASGDAIVNTKKDWHFVPASLCESEGIDLLAKSFRVFESSGIQVGNVNNMRAACAKIPFAFDYVKDLILNG